MSRERHGPRLEAVQIAPGLYFVPSWPFMAFLVISMTSFPISVFSIISDIYPVLLALVGASRTVAYRSQLFRAAKLAEKLTETLLHHKMMFSEHSLLYEGSYAVC